MKYLLKRILLGVTSLFALRNILPAAFVIIVTLSGCLDGSNSSGNSQKLPALGVEVTLDSGVVRGHEHPESAVWEWLGILFAKPPVGDLRWRAPQPVEDWEGIREATSFGNPCPQLSGNSVTGDEDCLNLNVWRPRTQERDLPVYVWIHGGGNKTGSISLSRLQGDRLAQQSNVVVVSIQFRLGALGWLYYEPLHTGDPLDDSGNFGLLDIILGLQWVQENIETFGGDPDNVIVGGAASGAENILSLLLSERASGLFHKAIDLAGIPGSPSPEEGSKQAKTVFDNLNASMESPLIEPTDQEISEFMRSRSAAEIVQAASSFGVVYAIADGTVVASEGTALFAGGDYINKVPIILGSNRDEYKLYTSILNTYPDVNDDVRAGIGRYVSDVWRVRAADQFATYLTTAPDQPEVYVYRFNWGSPDEAGNSPLPGNLGQTLGAHHGLEIGFVLGNWDVWLIPEATDALFTEESADGRKNLSEAIIQYFAAFAHSGNPNGDNLPVWEPFTIDGKFKAIQFDVNLQDSSPRITVDDEIYTVESILASLETNLEEPTRSEVRDVVLTHIASSEY